MNAALPARLLMVIVTLLLSVLAVHARQPRSGDKAAVEVNKLLDTADRQMAAGKMEAAGRDNEAATAMLEKLAQPASDAVLRAAAQAARLGQHFTELHKHAEARPYYRRNMALHERLYGEVDPRTDPARTLLANNADMDKDDETASVLRQRQIALSEQRGELRSVDYATALTTLAAYRAFQRRYAEALSLWQRVADLRAQLMPEDKVLAGRSLRELALLHQLAGENGKAQPLLEQAIALSAPIPVMKSLAGENNMLHRRLRFYLAYDLYMRRVFGDQQMAQSDPARYFEEMALITQLARGAREADFSWQRALQASTALRGVQHPETLRLRALVAQAQIEAATP